jgi:actin related protein 2/3 complex subunit 3
MRFRFPLLAAYMRVYKSQQLSRIQNADDLTIVCGAPLLPLATGSCTDGPCTVLRSSPDFKDIVAEAIELFRFIILMKNRFDIRSSADKVLVYLILWIQRLLQIACTHAACSKEELAAVLLKAAKEPSVPGDDNFPLNMFFLAPVSAKEKLLCSRYLEQLRLETARRLATRIWDDQSMRASKWWTQFAEVNWMGLSGGIN